MAELPLDQAVPRFKANEDRLDTFVNSATGYTTSGGTSVQSIQQFLASIGSNGIDFVDNAKARFGTGNDLEIYHSGSGSFIKDTGTGDLTIDGSAISIQTASVERISVSASGIDVTGTVEFDGLSGTGAVTITDIADEDNMASNSATKLATQQSIKAYVDAQVGTADTLSEVLGLGNTTGGTDIAVSANDDITFTDSSKAIFGAGSDLQIYHDASNSYIKEAGTGNLFIDATSLRLRTGAGTETYLTADGNGSVDLYYDNAKKLETTSSGIDVTGNIIATGKLTLESSDPEIFLVDTTTNVTTSIDSNSSAGSLQIHVDKNETGSNPRFIVNVGSQDSVLSASTSGIDVTGNVEFDGLSGTGSVTVTDILDEDDMTSDSATALATQQSIKAYVDANAGGGGLPTTGGTMTGDILFNDGVKAKYGTSSDLQIFHDGSDSYIKDSGTGILFLRTNELKIQSDDGLETYATFVDNGAVSLYYDNAVKLATTTSGIDVTGNIDATGNIVSDGSLRFGSGGAYEAGSIYSDANWGMIHRAFTASPVQADHLFVNSAGTERMRIDATGIDVTGSTITTGTSGTLQWSAGTAGQKLAIYGYDNSTFYHRLDSGNATNYQWGAYDNIPIYTITNNTIRTTLLGNGNFGIGDTSPEAPLTVTGTIKSNGSGYNPTNTGWATNASLITSGSYGGGLTMIDGSNAFSVRVDTGGLAMRIAQGATSGALGSDIAVFTNNGLDVTGNIDLPDNGKLLLGASDDLQIYHDGSNSIIDDSGTGNLYIRSNDVLIDKYTGERMIRAIADGAVTLYHNNAEKLATTSSGIDVTGDITATGNIDMPDSSYIAMGTSDDLQIVHTGGNSWIRDVGTGALFLDTNSAIHLYANGSENMLYAVPNGAVTLYYDNASKLATTSSGISVTGDLTVSSTIEVGSLTPNQDGAIEVGVIALGTPAISSTTDSTSLRNHIIFDNPNGAVGKINTLNSSTSYLTSSDYRLKTDVQEMTGSIDRVKALRPVNFEWVVDGTRVDGFLAHEAQEVVPEAVDGEKDAMRDQQYVESEATGDIYTPAVEATYETIQVELTPAVDAVYETVTVEISPAVEATYDDDGNELTPAVEAVTEEQEQLVTPAVDATYEEQQQELTPAIDEVIHSSDVVEPDELEEGQLWRETTEKVMATRQVPDYQGIDQSKIVPLLTSALQDAIAKIEALETRLEALEA